MGHPLLQCSLAIRKQFTPLTAFIDCGASGSAFIDRSYAQSHNMHMHCLKTPIELTTFDGSPAGDGPITHYVSENFQAGSGGHRLTNFYVTRLPTWPIVLGTPWLRANRALLDFDKLQLLIPASLTDANAPEGVFESSPLVLEETSGSLSPESPPGPSPKAPRHVDISMIGASPFARLCRKKGHVIGAITLQDIQKALSTKEKPDPATMLPNCWKHRLDVFDYKAANELPPHRPYDHKIPLQAEKTPSFGALYGMSRDELLVCKKYLEDNLKKGFIRPSKSQAAAPVLFVKKPGGGLRFCVDYRALNAITVKNRYPIPLFKETLHRLSQAKWYTKLDIIAAYNALRISPGEEWKTAFRTRYGLYEYLVMPFGLANAPSDWQHFINDILREHLDEFCTAYLDDILIYSDTEEEHVRHVDWVLAQLQKAGIQADIEKCVFRTQEVKYLGLIIGTDGARMDPIKVQAIQEWSAPKCPRDVLSFLGFANFYRRFVGGFSKIAGPLTELTKKDTPWDWTPRCQEAFDKLKKAFMEGPVLGHFNPDKECLIECDASDRMIGGVFSQRDANDVWRPVAYFSQKMIPAECNYEIYDKELLAIVRAFEEWRPELEGSKYPVQVLSDHKNLEYFKTSKLLNRRQARWSEYLSRFDFKIVYRSGKLNSAADALSRQSGDFPSKGEDKTMLQQVLKPENFEISGLDLQASTISDHDSRASSPEDPETPVSDTDGEDPELEDQFTEACTNDEEYQEVKAALEAGQPRRIRGFPLAEAELVHGQVYYRDGRKLVPKDDALRLRIIQLAHDTPLAGHPGAQRCYEILARSYHWSGMIADVKRFVRNCHLCAKTKYFRARYHGVLKPLPVPERRWADISIDFVVHLPASKNLHGVECKNIMVVVDRLSKEVYYEAINDLTPLGVARVYYSQVWKNTGLPDTIVSDRGTQFVNSFWDQLCKRLNIKANLSTAFHPQTDGQTERANSVMEQYLRTYCAYLQDDWAMWLPSAEFAANNHWSESIQCTPFFANRGYHPKMGLEPKRELPGPPGTDHERRLRVHADAYAEQMDRINHELQAQMTWAQGWHEEYANRHREHAPKRQVGDKVWLDTRNLATHRPTKKLANKNEGPFEITKVVSSHAYRLKLPDTWGCHNVFHTSLLHDAANDPLPGQKPPEPLPTNPTSGADLYEIVGINDSRSRGGRVEYLVTWKNDPEDWWVPFGDCEGAPELLKSYHDSHPGRVGEDTWHAYQARLDNGDPDYRDDPRTDSDSDK